MHCQKNERAMKKKWGWPFFSILVLLIFTTPQLTLSKDPVRIYFFYSEESGGLKPEEVLITPLSKKYPIEVKPLSVNQLNNYDLLTKFERQLKGEGLDLPIVVIGNNILGGEANIRRDLEGLVKSYSEKGGTPWPSLQQTQPTTRERWIPRAPTEEEQKSGKIIYAAFFYTPGCLECEETRADLRAVGSPVS